MTSWRMRSAGWLACAALLLLAFAVPAGAQQSAASYTVRKGDTMFAVARRTRHEGVDVNQMLLAIFRANEDAFPGGNIGVLKVGQVLRLPSRQDASSTPPAEARRQVQKFVSKRPPVRAAVEPREALAPPPKPPSAPPAKIRLGRDEAAKRYQAGLAMEERGDDKGALKAFLEAAESGHGLAQRKLGEIYDKGNSAVERDYETAIRWYQKAREQGVPIPKPLTRAPR